MKKLIAISVILVLLTAVAFAETSFSAAVIVKGTLLSGTTQDAYPGPSYDLEEIAQGTLPDPDDWYADPNYKGVKTGFEFKRLRIAASTSNDEGTFGGYIRFQQDPYADFNGFGWWKPIDQLRVQLGQNADGDFGVDNITGWNFYADANDVGFTGTSFSHNALFGGWGSPGLYLAITPIEALAINIGIPLDAKVASNDAWGRLAEYVYKKTTAQIAYTIDGVGKAAITYAGGALHKDAETASTAAKAYEFDANNNVTKPGVSEIPAKAEVNDPATVYASFDVSAIENLGLNVGVRFTFGYTQTGDLDTKNDDITYNGKLAVGLGATYDLGQFGFKARVQANLLGGVKNEATVVGVTTTSELKDPLAIGFDVLPYFAVSDAVKVFLDAGVVFTGATELKVSNPAGSVTVKENSILDFHVQPYLTYSAGAGTFYAGFRLDSNGKRSGEIIPSVGDKGTYALSNSYMTWSVPIGMAVSF